MESGFTIRFDDGDGYPNCFQDDCFDRFGENNVNISTSQQHYFFYLVVTFNSDNIDGGQVLKAFVKSNYFQTHAKKIIYCTLSNLRLGNDNWKPFLKTFAQHQPKLHHLELEECHFLTDEAARDFGGVLDSSNDNKNKLEVEILEFTDQTGSNEWISSGLCNNTTTKKITIIDCVDCWLPFLEFLRCPSEGQWEFIEYKGRLGQNDESSLDGNRYRGLIDKCQTPKTYYDYFLSLEMSYSWGMIYMRIDEDKDSGDYPPMCREWVEEALHPLLTLGQIKEIRVTLAWLRLEGCLHVFQTIAACDVPLNLDLFHHSNTDEWTEQDANVLGWLLDTNASGLNVATLKFCCHDGSRAWVPGLYKNKTIKNLHLEGFNFWHSALHFLQSGTAQTLESISLYNLGEEENETSVGIDEMPPSITNNMTMTEATRKILPRLERFGCGYYGHDEATGALPKNICESIGTLLQSATNLKYLEVKGLLANGEYDFLKDAVSCQEMSLENTDFEPRVLIASLNNGSRLKRLCLDKYTNQRVGGGWFNIVNLFSEDLSSLDELCIGGFIVSRDLGELCLLLEQNKNNGSRKFTGQFDIEEYRLCRFHLFHQHMIELSTSLAGNTKIEEIKLNVAHCLLHPDILKCLQSICSMPLLKKLEISGIEKDIELSDQDQQENKGAMNKCRLLAMRQFLERNVRIELPPTWLGDDNFPAMLMTVQQRLRHINDLSDGIWANIFASKEIDTDLLFYLVGQFPGLFQKAGNQV